MIKHKNAVITGAGRGIGRGICLALAKEGCDLIVNYIHNDEAAAETIRLCLLESPDMKIFPFKGDISEEATCMALMDFAAEKLGSIDILINNAGITKDGRLLKMKEDKFRDVISLNLCGTFFCSKAAAGYMSGNHFGRIINISSIAGIKGSAGQANYCASKAGILGLTRSMAKELAPYGITVNAICPGVIETDMTAVIPPEIKQSMCSRIPLGRTGTPEDIGHAAAFLASEGASYITGQALVIDGGFTA